MKSAHAAFLLSAFAVTWLRWGSALAADGVTSVTFTYTDPDATTVAVAGEFTNWEPHAMSRDDAGAWSRTVTLSPGVYAYKFVINGNDWRLDPKNPQRKSVGDVENSAITVGDTPVTSAAITEVTFLFRHTEARSVHVAGEFNHWLENKDGRVEGRTEWLMQNDGSGNWKLTAPIPPGKYKFKYVIDGGDKWEADPTKTATPDGNSLLEVAGAGGMVPEKPRTAPVREEGSIDVAFGYASKDAKEVFVAGDFNQWSMNASPLTKDEQGNWSAVLPLKPGRYQYKFIIDGVWKPDPANPETVDDQHGGSNSVKIVNP